jgi:AbrB family looped-hinge helix DNA binding protein
MHEVRLGEKGQVTLPKEIRDRYRLSKGDQVRMIDLGNGIMEVILLKRSRELPPPAVRVNKTASVERMKKAAAKAAVGRYKRSQKP